MTVVTKVAKMVAQWVVLKDDLLGVLSVAMKVVG
jgi:hypothetical protein